MEIMILSGKVGKTLLPWQKSIYKNYPCRCPGLFSLTKKKFLPPVSAFSIYQNLQELQTFLW